MKGMLETKLGSLTLRNPLMSASGTFGFGLEYSDFVHPEQVGAIVVKGTTLEPRSGNRGIRIAETPSGMLNCIGLENPGAHVFLSETLPKLAQYDTPIIVNISANSVEEYGLLAQKLDVPGVAAVEINISCPNVKEGGIVFGTQPEAAAAVVRSVKSSTSKPVITKLSPNVTSIVEMALAVEEAGTDMISLINTLIGMAINTRTWKPVLGNITGGLSGPAIKPVAVHMVYQVAQAVKVPIIGMGGIMTAEDAVEFFLAGASAVAIGTANFVQPDSMVTIAEGLEDYLLQHGLTNISQLVGQLKMD